MATSSSPASEDDPDTIATLRRMGFRDPGSVAAMVRSWHHGRPRATRSARARELLTELMPALLAAFARQTNPDAALVRFGTMLERLPAGVQVLSLFWRNPALLDRMAGILGAAPTLADHLARHPAALDGLLAADVLRRGRDRPRRLARARSWATRGTWRRRWTRRGGWSPSGASRSTPRRWRAHWTRTGPASCAPTSPRRRSARCCRRSRRISRSATAGCPAARLRVVAMGKLGGREMLPGSDLDLVLVYDHAADATGSAGGRRSLAPSEYFIRLAPQMVAALTAPGAEGRL